MVLLAAVVVSGCGDSDQQTTATTNVTATTLPTKAEFIKQANAACERERAGLMKRVSDFERQRGDRKPEPHADAVHFIFLPTMEAQIWRIEEIGIPRRERAKVDAMLDAERDAVDVVAVIPLVPSIKLAERHFAEPDKLFNAYGLTACATDAGEERKGT